MLLKDNDEDFFIEIAHSQQFKKEPNPPKDPIEKLNSQRTAYSLRIKGWKPLCFCAIRWSWQWN